MAVRMELSRILIRELNDYQIIELREAKNGTTGGAVNLSDEESDARSFPIVIGLPEAQAIERRIKGIQIKRPQIYLIQPHMNVRLHRREHNGRLAFD